MRLFEFQLLGFSLFGFQDRFGNSFAIRNRLAAGHRPWSARSRHGPRQLSAGRPRLFFQFLEPRVVSRFFPIGREVCLFFLNLQFFQVVVRNIASNIVPDIWRNLRRCIQICFALRLVHRSPRCRIGRRRCSRLIPRLGYFRRDAGRCPLHFFINFRVGLVLMLFVERLGNLSCKNRLILWKIRCDRRRQFHACTLSQQSWNVTRTRRLTLILRDRFAGKQDGLISRGRSVIVVASGARGGRCHWPLESRIRSAASRTVAAVEAFVTLIIAGFIARLVARFTPWYATGLTPRLIAGFVSNLAALRMLAAARTRSPTTSVAGLPTTSATTPSSAKIPRRIGGVARSFRRSR